MCFLILLPLSCRFSLAVNILFALRPEDHSREVRDWDKGHGWKRKQKTPFLHILSLLLSLVERGGEDFPL